MTAPLMQKIPEQRSSTGEKVAARKLLRGYLHKTSNSLCGIKGYADLIANREAPGSLSGHWAQKILSEINRMEEVFLSVGDMTRVLKPFRSGFDLRGVFNRAWVHVVLRHPGTTLKISELPEGQLLLPEADLELVLKEILSNCAQSADRVAIQVKGQIDLTGRIVLCISDNGPGMGPELLKQATDPFVTTREGHHGVGLTRVETILDIHGLVWALTSTAGQGTTTTLEVATALSWNPEIV